MIREDWTEGKLEDLLNYVQPTNYIVDSTAYNDTYKTPVLTAGKTFILGYTNEENNIFTELPVIIFDDFTTATKYVNFKFKVKSSAMKILVPTSDKVNVKYVYYYMQTIRYNVDTHKRYWISIFSKLNILIAPLPEQRAIVAKIEELFSELDSGIDSLKKARKQLEVYRQAVLKSAFEGKLTKEWRNSQDNLETGAKLLKEIKKIQTRDYNEQLKAWENEVEIWERKGKDSKKPKKPRQLDRTVFDNYDTNFYTPKEWIVCQIADVISDLTDYHANGSYAKLKENVELLDIPSYAVMVRATNFEKDDFSKDLKYIDEYAYNFLSKSKLFGGEILIGKIGNAGKVYLMPNLNKPASLAMNLFAIKTSYISSKFLYYQLNSFHQGKEIRSYIKGVGNPTIDKISVRSIHINLCSNEEQEEIIKEIESRLSVCENIEATIEEALEKAEALRQSILKKAFEGKLLSNEELEACRRERDWEPAADLLKRIKEDKKGAKSNG